MEFWRAHNDAYGRDSANWGVRRGSAVADSAAEVAARERRGAAWEKLIECSTLSGNIVQLCVGLTGTSHLAAYRCTGFAAV